VVVPSRRRWAHGLYRDIETLNHICHLTILAPSVSAENDPIRAPRAHPSGPHVRNKMLGGSLDGLDQCQFKVDPLATSSLASDVTCDLLDLEVDASTKPNLKTSLVFSAAYFPIRASRCRRCHANYSTRSSESDPRTLCHPGEMIKPGWNRSVGERTIPQKKGTNSPDNAFALGMHARGCGLAYRQIIGDAAMVAILGFLAAVIAGAF